MGEPICKWCCHPRWTKITLLPVVCILVLSLWPGCCRHRCWACTTVLQPSDSLHWCIQKLGGKDPWIYWSPQRRSNVTYRISLFGAVCSPTFHQVITIILSTFSPLLPLKNFETCCVCKWVIREKVAQEGNIKYDQALKNWVVGSALDWKSGVLGSTLSSNMDLLYDPEQVTCLITSLVSFFVKMRRLGLVTSGAPCDADTLGFCRVPWCVRYFLGARVCRGHCVYLTGFYLQVTIQVHQMGL